MWAVDPRRYTDYADADYCKAKALETYGHEYGMHFPHKAWPAGRDKKLSPNHDAVIAAGGQMGAYNGWERANWYARDGENTSEDSTQTWGRSGPWQAAIKREVEAVSTSCGMLPITGFSRYKIEGAGAKDFVDGLTASQLPKEGRVTLAYFPDSRGRILTETSVMVHSDSEVGLITAATAQWHDFEIFSRQLPEGVTITDYTKDVECLLVTGPKARAVLASLVEGHDLAAPWLSVSMDGTVVGQPCTLIRVSFAGELGWEIHAAPDAMPAIWDALSAGGVVPFGMYALNSMRIEKGYRGWKGDLSTDYTLLEGGLDRFMKLDKPVGFPGKLALIAETKAGRKKGFVTLEVEAGDTDAPYMAPIWHGDEIVGEVTSCAMGYRTDKCIALGMIRIDLLEVGTSVEVDVFGKRHKAVVQHDQPMWDPKNERIRA